jgi:hypothetical protein
MDKRYVKGISSAINRLQEFQDERPPGDGAVQDAINGLTKLLDGNTSLLDKTLEDGMKRYKVKVRETTETVGYIIVEAISEEEAREKASNNNDTVHNPKIVNVDIAYTEVKEHK